MHDYRYRFKADKWAAAIGFMRLVTSGEISNMLGDPLTAEGAPAAPGKAVVYARRGRAARTLTGLPGGETVTIPARGNPGYWYVHVRSDVAPADLPADPVSHGFEPVTAEESAEVLGVWAE